MTWRYIATRTESKYEDEDGHWDIREWFDGNRTGFTADAQTPYGETREELIQNLEMMLADVKEGAVLHLKESDPDYWKKADNEVSN